MQRYLYSVITDQAKGPMAGALKVLLYLLSLIYGLGVNIIKFSYRAGICRSSQLEKPVISIGNITWGGVGKTPLVLAIAEFIKGQNLQPAILTRGYRAEKSSISDEAVDLEQTLKDIPVIVGENRVKGAQDFLQEETADVFLLDDGFQHWPLKRDLDIVAVNATNPFGNKCLIPRGILRESLKSLSRADIFVITKSDLGHTNIEYIKRRLKAVNPGAPVVETIHKPECFERLSDREEFYLMLIKDKAVCSFCGIGDPQSFEDTLASLGAEVRKNFSFMDHHSYTREDIRKIVDYCRSRDIQYIVTTSKDAVKVIEYADLFGEDLQCWVLNMKIQIADGKGELFGRISHLLHR